MSIIALTGHRPKDLVPQGSDETPYGHWMQSSIQLAASVAFQALQPERVVSGMAIGFDQCGAAAANELGIPVFAVIPFKGQEKRWPPASREEYRRLIAEAHNVYVMHPEPYEAWKMHARNEYMVDVCDYVLALWSGKHYGGTFSCLKYALKQGKLVYNLYPIFEHIVHREEIDESTLPELQQVTQEEVFGNGES